MVPYGISIQYIYDLCSFVLCTYIATYMTDGHVYDMLSRLLHKCCVILFMVDVRK